MISRTTTAGIDSNNYRFLQEHVYSQSGIVLGDDKHYLFESRLEPIVMQLGLGCVNDLCALLRATRPTEAGRQVVEAMTTNETYFFRDPAHYDAIRTVLLPQLKEERRDARKLRFWSAAASTGQEAYSLSMILQEQSLQHSFPPLRRRLAVERDRARDGSLRNHRPSPEHAGAGTIRSGVLPQCHDLFRHRNKDEHFETTPRHAVPGGWLLLGGAETAFGAEEWFEKHAVGSATIYVAR